MLLATKAMTQTLLTMAPRLYPPPPRHVQGIIAGMMTKTNKICYVASIHLSYL